MKIFGLWTIYPPSVTVIALNLDNILGVEILAVSIRSRKTIHCSKISKFNFFSYIISGG